MALDLAELDSLPDLADDMYMILSEFDPGDEADAGRMKKLFLISQAIMIQKGESAKLLEEQVTDNATGEAKSIVKKDQEIEELRTELQGLKKRNRELERLGLGPGLSSDAELRNLRDLNDDLERQVSDLHRDIREKEQQLSEERKISEQYIARADDAEKRLREYKIDNEQLRDDLRDRERQLEAHRETMFSKQDTDAEARGRLREKNQMLNDALTQNKNLADANSKLEEEIERLQKEMEHGREEILKTTDEYLKMRMEYGKLEQSNDNLRKKIAVLEEQIKDMEIKLKSQSEADDEIMIQVDRKVQECETVFAEKDKRIFELQQQIMRLREDLAVSNIDTNKASVMALTKALEEREKKCELLADELREAKIAIEDNEALLKDVDARIIRSGQDPKDQTRRRLNTLQNDIRSRDEQLLEMESRMQSAESDAREKDKQLNELLERMSQYERGVFGLPEAVTEIKLLKRQICERDRNIEELTQYVNRCELQINDLYDEAEELRERLGLDPKEPINIEGIRQRKAIKVERDRALNRVLQKEIERLEDERINLKQQIRSMAQTTGQKAVAMGLNADEVAAVDAFIDQLKSESGSRFLFPSNSRRDPRLSTDVRIKEKVMSDDLEKNAKRINLLYEENTEMKTKIADLEEENTALEQALREIQQQISSMKGIGTNDVLKCVALDRMLSAMEARSIVGRFDKSVILKAQVDNLTGRNDELRRELKDTRCELLKIQDNFSRATRKNESLEMEVKSMKEAGAGGWFQMMPLPQDLAPTSANVIASLNEHLVIALQELSVRESTVEKMEEELEGFRRKFAIVRHQQSLLYQEYLEEKKNWESERQLIKDQLMQVQGCREEDQVKIQEFDRLVDTLAQDEPEVRRRLADTSRKMTVLRVNEKALSRRFTILEDVNANLQKANSRLKNEMISMEKTIAERLGYLQRHKDMAAFQIASLQKTLDESVAAADFEKVNREHTELCEKYRELLDSSNSLVALKEETTGYQMEMKSLIDENNAMKKEMEIEKEKLHTLEAAFERIRKQGLAKSQDLGDNELLSIAQRMTTLEMKELNERQKAEHACRMYEQQKTTLRHLEDRNFELEQKFSQLTKMHLEIQKLERELRDELANAVPKSVSDADRKRIHQLEGIEANLRNEVSKLKDISEVATMQVKAIQSQQVSHDKELISLRQQLIDIQAQSDEKTVIGKLHRHIVQLQMSEGMASRRLDEAKMKLTKLDALSLRMEQRADEKEQTIYHNRLESRSKVRHLKQTIQELRTKYSGSVPLSDQERFTQLMVKLQESQKNAENDLRTVREERRQVEDKLAELQLQHNGLQELIATLKDGKGAQKVAEWHSRMEAVRLEDLRYKRDIEKLKQQMKFLDAVVKKHETDVLLLEEDKIRQRRDFETRELEWEQREVELERVIVKLERQQAEIAGAASLFEEAIGSLPDGSWPIAQQLDHAVMTIKRNVKLILDNKAQTEHFKTRVEELEKELRQKEGDVLSRDRVITELRLRLPSTADRDAVFAKITNQSAKQPQEDYEGSQAVRVAHSTVASLQARLAQKEDALARCEDFLKQARADMETMSREHNEEMRSLQHQLHSRHDAIFKKYKSMVNESLNQPDKPVPTNDQLRRLNELEDIVAEQNNSNAALRDKLLQSKQEINELKMRHSEAAKQAADEKESMKQDLTQELRQMGEKYEVLSQDKFNVEKKLEITEKELEEQKEANSRAPTRTMRNLVEKLKNDLAIKEKELQSVCSTLLDLRRDMVSQAQSEVKANADLMLAETNVKKLVDKKTKELQDRVEEFDELNKKLKGEIKKSHEREKELGIDLELAKDNLVKKEVQVKKLKDEKDSLTSDIDDLKQKIHRMNTMPKQKSETDAFHRELEELRRKNHLLAEELEREKLKAEKPYEQDAIALLPAHSEDPVAKWEEGKKMQKKMDVLKLKLKEKDAEIDKLQRSNEHLKNALERANRDKEILRGAADLRSADGQIRAVSASALGRAPTGGSQVHTVQELERRNHELEDEVSSLKRRLAMGRDAEFEEIQMKNKFLSEKIHKLEKSLLKRSSGPVMDQGLEYRELAKKEKGLQEQVFRLTNENFQLSSELDQANRDIPRFKERIESLQKYTEILKSEKQQLMNRSRDSLSSLFSTPSSNIRRIGESGRSVVELEKVIAALKKAVEKTQAENEQLKKASSYAAAEQMNSLQKENQSLRSQLEELRQKVGASLSERYNSQQKGTAKIMSDYEKLRKDLVKEMETNEKLRMRLKQLELTVEQSGRQLEDKNSVLDVDDAKRSSIPGMNQKEWKANIAVRVAEEKAKRLEEDNEEKNKTINDMKALLKEATKKEQRLLQEKRDLEEKIAILERFPPGTKVTDANLMRDYQLSRLTIERLENEKRQLQHELQSSKSSADVGGVSKISDMTEEEIKRKLKSHDILMHENDELNVRIKMVQLEKSKLEQELTRLKKELGNFGPEFFDEIEDLKFNYQEALKRNILYEEQLTKLSKQFGVDVDIPR